jgi:putative phage-type endonuclease
MFVPLSEQGELAGHQFEQGSEEWFEKRKHKMTGSKPSSIFFECKDEESYHKMWSIIFGEVKPDPFDDRQMLAVNWGKDMEDVAAERFYNTLPGTIVYETSIIDHPTYDWIAASPDGYIVRVETDDNGQAVKPYKVIERANFEIKCPASHLRDAEGVPIPYEMAKCLKKKKNPPYYYLTQLHFEMVALGTPVTYFYMWTPWFSRVWKVHFDHHYWQECISVLDAFRRKNLPWEVLHSKIQTWRNTSQAIARKYQPLYDWEHAPEGVWEKHEMKSLKPVKMSLPEKEILAHSWYSPEEKSILKQLFGR